MLPKRKYIENTERRYLQEVTPKKRLKSMKSILQWRRNFVFTWLPIFMVLLFISCGDKKAEETSKKSTQALTIVEIEKVQEQEINEKISVVGRIEGLREVDIYSEFAGFVESILVDEGDLVKKDQILMNIDRSPLTGHVYRPFPVKAKIEGVVSEVFVEIGEQVSPQRRVSRIVQMDEVKVQVDIPQKSSDRIQKGNRAEISLDSRGKEKFEGVVQNIFPTLDPMTLTVRTEIQLENQEFRLKPGSFVRTDLFLEKKKTILVPLDSVILEDNIRYLYLYNINTQSVSRRNVEIGQVYNESIEILSGLKVGESYLVKGQNLVFEGEKVQMSGTLQE